MKSSNGLMKKKSQGRMIFGIWIDMREIYSAELIL